MIIFAAYDKMTLRTGLHMFGRAFGEYWRLIKII